MKESTHTAGDWVVGHPGNGVRIESKDQHGVVNDGWVIAEFFGPDAEGNAARCAAAPAVYEALEQMLDAIENGSIDSPEIGEPEVGIPLHKWHEEWAHYARAALQSAKGAPR